MKFQTALEDCNYQTRSYSGRGMNGRTCLGVILEHYECPFKMFANILEDCTPDEQDEVIQAMKNVKTDSLGLGTIVYFPNIEFVPTDELASFVAMCDRLAPAEDE